MSQRHSGVTAIGTLVGFIYVGNVLESPLSWGVEIVYCCPWLLRSVRAYLPLERFFFGSSVSRARDTA